MAGAAQDCAGKPSVIPEKRGVVQTRRVGMYGQTAGVGVAG